MLNGEKLVEAINGIWGYMALIRMTDTDNSLIKYYNFEGKLLLKTSSFEKEECEKVLKYLQGMNVVDEGFKTNKQYISDGDLEEYFKHLVSENECNIAVNRFIKKEIIKTNLKTKYSGRWYTIFKQEDDKMVMAESRYVDCFTNACWKTTGTKSGNAIYISDSNNKDEYVAILKYYKSIHYGILGEGEDVSIEQYIKNNGYVQEN